ncbi:MAG: peptidoglycan DD-metalloendopeptidase family protein [Deltaproteobacteria bacterium]|nr:peptidoglycan DD-metalloendopeptidase family protein [Deltaproteobacteria bacterium]
MRTIRILFCLLALVSCADVYTARGVYHRVKAGENLITLSETFQVPLQDLAELNNIEDPGSLKIGEQIFIPGVRAARFESSQRRRRKGKASGGSGKVSLPTIETDHGRFAWPLKGELSSTYGVRRGRRHDGIDVRAPRGTPIRASSPGKVVYSRRMQGYGNLILLKHSGNFFTVYAHNSVNLVKKGAKIAKGQVIAKVGSTGRATGPHLHFEVREGRKPRNPLFFLPKVK